jgi:hypothetical protein
VYAIGVGPRVASPFLHVDGRDPLDFRVFAQVLAGGMTSDVIAGGRIIQPGFGADFGLRSGAILRFEWDHAFVRGSRALSGSRVLAGLVFGAGSTGP